MLLNDLLFLYISWCFLVVKKQVSCENYYNFANECEGTVPKNILLAILTGYL